MSAAVCRSHPDRAAAWQCAKCGALYCDSCVKVVPLGAKSARVCPTCRELCVSISSGGPRGAAAAAGASAAEAEDRPAFWQTIPGAFVYPFRGMGIFLFILGSVFFAAQPLLNVVLFGYFGAAIRIGVTAYLAAYMFSIVKNSAMGRYELPDWPSLAEFSSDILWPAWVNLGVSAFCWLPAIAIGVAGAILNWPFEMVLPAMAGLHLIGSFYFPMALLSVVMHDELRALSPTIVVPAILKTFASYTTVFLLLQVMVGAYLLIGRLLEKSPWAGGAIRGVVLFYLMIVFMRLLGLLYHTHEDRLGWFKNL